MERRDATGLPSSTRTIGWVTISSGIIGLLAIGCLATAVTTRTTWSLSNHVYLLFRAHDIGVVLQLLLLIPFVLEIGKWSAGNRSKVSSSLVVLGISAISLVALLLILGTANVVNDMFYMLPQGAFGAWLIVINVRLSGLLPRWLRTFGIIVGLGLVSVGFVFPGLATFVYPNMWKIPAVPVDNETFVQSGVNRALHLILVVGSLLGVLTLPIWTLLIGSKLLRRKPYDVATNI